MTALHNDTSGATAALQGHEILLGFGSNLGDRRTALMNGLSRLSKLAGLRQVRRSRLYASEPVGVTEQPVFLNMVVRAVYAGTPQDLLGACKSTEIQLGRKARGRWQARELDIDILLYAGEHVDLADLQIPHPRMHERRFVLVPAAEIAADMIHPLKNMTLAQLAAACADNSQVEVFGEDDGGTIRPADVPVSR